MKRKHFGFIVWLGIISVIPIFLFCTFVTNSKPSVDQNAYFENFNLVFNGVVTEKEITSNGAGIVRLDLNESNVNFYDPREKYGNYFCVIKNEKAELVMSRLFLVKIGDSIVVNDSVRLYRAGKLKEKWKLHLSTSATYLFIDSKHKL